MSETIIALISLIALEVILGIDNIIFISILADKLPENQRNVFIWNELEEMTLQQIADKENENIKTIISRKRYAVIHLRNRMEYLYNEIVHY